MTLLERDMENREEGKEEGIILITHKLIKKGMSFEEIADITGLSIEKIKQEKDNSSNC